MVMSPVKRPNTSYWAFCLLCDFFKVPYVLNNHTKAFFDWTPEFIDTGVGKLKFPYHNTCRASFRAHYLEIFTAQKTAYWAFCLLTGDLTCSSQSSSEHACPCGHERCHSRR